MISLQTDMILILAYLCVVKGEASSSCLIPIQLMIATHPLDKDAMNRVSTRWPICRILLANWYNLQPFV
jgi:hypothetical protein